MYLIIYVPVRVGSKAADHRLAFVTAAAVTNDWANTARGGHGACFKIYRFFRYCLSGNGIYALALLHTPGIEDYI